MLTSAGPSTIIPSSQVEALRPAVLSAVAQAFDEAAARGDPNPHLYVAMRLLQQSNALPGSRSRVQSSTSPSKKSPQKLASKLAELHKLQESLQRAEEAEARQAAHVITLVQGKKVTAAATTIQSCYHGHVARCWAFEQGFRTSWPVATHGQRARRESMLEQAAVAIQSCYNGFCARSYVRGLLADSS